MIMRGISLFASAGIGETYLSEVGVNIIVANELIKRRADLHSCLYPNCKTICGDITDHNVFAEIIESSKDIDFLLASPPCQGMSIAGKNRHQETMITDKRNFLINYVFDAIELLSPKYVLIENVKQLLKIKLPYKDNLYTVVEILNMKFGEKYEIEGRVVDAADYGVPQTRIRAIIKMYPKDSQWNWPTPVSHKKTVEDTIGHLPSLEAGEDSGIKWHKAKPEVPRLALAMKHTPQGKSAIYNDIYYPKKEDGTRIKGFHNTFKRMVWNQPCPARTTYSGSLSSHNNVHPGRLLPDGTYSDARVLTPLELMLLNSLPENWNIPEHTPEILIRQVIGESIPPLMIKKIVEEIPELK